MRIAVTNSPSPLPEQLTKNNTSPTRGGSNDIKSLFCDCQLKVLPQYNAHLQIIISLSVICYYFLHKSSLNVKRTAICLYFLTILLASILVLGVCLKIPELLLVWLLITGLELLLLSFMIIFEIYTCLFQGHHTSDIVILLVFIVLLGVTYASFRIVLVYRRELNEIREQEISQLRYPRPHHSFLEQTDLDIDYDFDIDDASGGIINPEAIVRHDSASTSPFPKSDSVQSALLTDPESLEFELESETRVTNV